MRYPFSPEFLDALPEELAELFRELEAFMLGEICDRLKLSEKLNEVTVQDIRVLRSHGIDLEAIKKAIAETSEVSLDKVNALLDDVVQRNQTYFDDLASLAQVTKPQRYIDKSDVEAILNGGDHVLTVMDICGAMALKTHFKNVITIYIKRDKRALLTSILRKNSSVEDKVNRLLSIEGETKNAQVCDYVVDLTTCRETAAQILRDLRGE